MDQENEMPELRRKLMEDLKRYLLEGAKWIRKLPLRTRAGYRIFLANPAIFAVLLRKVQK